MRRLLLLSVIVALVAAACSGGSGVVGSVNGDEILVSDVSVLLTDTEDGTAEGAAFSSTLFNVIVDRVLTAEAVTQFGVALDDATVAAEREGAVAQLTAGGISLEDAMEAQGLNEARLDAIVRQQVLFDQIEEALAANAPEPSEADLQAAFDAQLQQLTNVCASHILLETEEAAQDALDRALAGEDFAELAMELSTGPSGPDGGDLGCAAPSNYVPEFAVATMAAEVGTPIGPIQTQFGQHVILVTERTSPTFEESREEIAETLTTAGSADRFFEWAIEQLRQADVVIDEQYGSWTTEPQPTVLPPGS